MKILACHNYYKIRGGEDQSFEDEVELLRSGGHEVQTYTRHNDEVDQISQLAAAAQTLHSRRSANEVAGLVDRFRPQVVHFTNTFPLISPAAYGAARRHGAAVVQALRNYRLICPGAYLMRDGRPCEQCVGRQIQTAAVRHKCYRDSRAGSAVVAGLNTLHRTLGTWDRGVDVFYTLTNFARSKFIQGGLPADKILVKPNSVTPDPGVGDGAGRYAVFAGRLSPEKGISTLMHAWDRLPNPIPLKIIGDGPLEEELRGFAAEREHVEVLGRLPHAEVLEVIGRASLLVMPSVWYETFGRTIIEAYAKGTPVVASDLGAMAELVTEGQTGLLAAAGDAASLATQVQRLSELPEGEMQAMRARCRQQYERNFTPAENVELLLAVYHRALTNRGAVKHESAASPTTRRTAQAPVPLEVR